MEKGADLEIANRHGHTCLMIACYKGHIAIVRYLLDKGADVKRRSLKGDFISQQCFCLCIQCCSGPAVAHIYSPCYVSGLDPMSDVLVLAWQHHSVSMLMFEVQGIRNVLIHLPLPSSSSHLTVRFTPASPAGWQPRLSSLAAAHVMEAIHGLLTDRDCGQSAIDSCVDRFVCSTTC